MDAICWNCGKLRQLRNSHAIPNTFFKPLARSSNGQFILLTDGPSKAERSQESGQDFLLCSSCEHIFGRKFDHPLSEEFRRIRSAFSRCERIEISNAGSIKSSIASIIWRVSISSSLMYKSFKIPYRLRENLYLELWCENDSERNFSYSVQPIFDRTSRQDGGFGAKELENFLLTPKQWKIAHGFSGRQQSGWGAIFVAGGIAVTMLEPRLSAYKERQKFYLLSNDRISRIRPVDMWTVPYLREFLAYAVHKEKA
jgi:hypothetical protein